LFAKYNGLGHKDNHIISDSDALKILQEDLLKSNKIEGLYQYKPHQIPDTMAFQKYPSLNEIPQPKSIFLRFNSILTR